MEQTEDLINVTKKKWPKTKIALSLTTPRQDDDLNSANASVINALTKRKFKDTENLQKCDHANMSTVKPSVILKKDNIHLTQDGVAMLSANIKRAVFKSLGMEKSQNQQNGPRNQQNGSHSQSPPRDRRFNHPRPSFDRFGSQPRDFYNNNNGYAPYHNYEYRDPQHEFSRYRSDYPALYVQDRRTQQDRHSNHWNNDRW